jgi:hypothetical protein
VQYDHWLEGNNWQVCIVVMKKLTIVGSVKIFPFNQTRTVAYFSVVVVGDIGFSPYGDCLNRKY